MKDRLVMGACRTLVWIFQHLPRKSALAFGARLGTRLYGISEHGRRTALDNLHRAYGKRMTEEEIVHIAKDSFINAGKNFAEFCRLPIFRQESDGIFTVQGTEILNRLIARGKGIVLVSGHIGNWELIHASLCLRGYEVTAIAKAQRVRGFELMAQSFREACGVTVFQNGLGLRGALKALRDGKILLILADQHGGKGGVLGRLFDQVVSLPKGPVAFALKTDAVIVPAFMLRNEDDTHTLQISEPFNLILAGDKEADLEYNTRRLAKVIEERIRLTPAQWMWSYERFTHDISGMTADLESLVI
jgi:KDO2-lipid IV(A) lauroyltransferase